MEFSHYFITFMNFQNWELSKDLLKLINVNRHALSRKETRMSFRFEVEVLSGSVIDHLCYAIKKDI
ncbi:hypothetical protein OUZ56_027873 [Daphnia magna]|uniref:Uncharacterized protein n=1 Tax=Daphnia magna TaxID=35525 RepID=A0ABR0B2A2_9CRUS|nr:hypothetical protein OUZ56_027873 [Daphnia magna]